MKHSLKARLKDNFAMTVKVTTRHDEAFEIHTVDIAPEMSPYATTFRDYAARIREFYATLGIRSAIWTTPAMVRPKYLEAAKPVEYLLEINDDRVAAYVDEATWTDYLSGKRRSFDYSTTSTHFEITSILVETPIKQTEVKALRRYRTMNGPGKYELVEEITF